jgi:type IV pilus assembly protein PilW
MIADNTLKLRITAPLAQQKGEQGFTLVELLVAMAISTIIGLAAVSALMVARRGFSAVDASSQLRDNGRYAADLIQRIAVQTGFKDVIYVTRTPTAAEIASIPPSVSGFDNAEASSSDPLNASTARTASIVGYGSDVLVLRYQALETFTGSGVADGSMINCSGQQANSVPSTRDETWASVFHVDIGPDGEPALMCTTASLASGVSTAQPVIQGVENFQVLYGVEGFTSVGASFSAPLNAAPIRYLRADQMVVGSASSAATWANWRNVRSIRIGMVIRGPLNSAQDRGVDTEEYYPFGAGKSSGSAVKGSALSSGDDKNTVFKPGADGRMRHVVTFTVHLRNDQGA